MDLKSIATQLAQKSQRFFSLCMKYLSKGVRATLKYLISFLPRRWRFHIYRTQIRVPLNLSDDYTFKIAQTQEELEAAFQILHDAYVEGELMAPEESGLRVTVYHALPSTTTIIAKYKDEVVGTLSIVRSGKFGLPSDKLGHACFARTKDHRVAEISALAVKKAYRGKIYMPMLKFMYHICRHRLGIDTLVAVVSARQHVSDYYEAILGFKKWIDYPINYSFVNNSQSSALYLNLEEAFFTFAKYYAHRPPANDLFTYFVRLRLHHFSLPNKEYFDINSPVMTPELLDHFFNKKTHVFSKLTHEEVGKLYYIFQRHDFRKVLPTWIIEKRGMPRERFEVNCTGQVSLTDTESRPVRMLEASMRGMRIKCEDHTLLKGQNYDFVFLVSEFETVKVTASVEWAGPPSYGLKLNSLNESWVKFISTLASSHYAA